MSDMQEKFAEKTEKDRDDVRAADPEEGITSLQNANAQFESQAEGDRLDDATEDTAR
ncbi:hypothetical protein [Saccharothrix sp. ST-888]|uniref:hypothetical protein n=1 Tax=Saccharothrix sp. ST-888 TaxID=1427391 RepID=UPI000AE27D86|nr:hypothetical protein [Saccharothrix sp. ST-888]